MKWLKYLQFNRINLIIGVGLGGFALLFWRGQQAVQSPNLLRDPDFQAGDWSSWQLLNTGDAQALFKGEAGGSEETVVELTINDAPQGNALYAKALAPLMADYLLEFQARAMTPIESKN